MNITDEINEFGEKWCVRANFYYIDDKIFSFYLGDSDNPILIAFYNKSRISISNQRMFYDTNFIEDFRKLAKKIKDNNNGQ